MINRIKGVANTEEKKRLLSNFFSLSVLQVFTYILPLLTLPYLVRTLGVKIFGLVMFAQSFMVFFNILVDYGFALSATREISIHRNNKNKVTEIFSAVIIIKLILILLSLLILSVIVLSFDKFSANWELYYLAFLWVIGQALFPIWYFQGLEKMKYITIVNIISKLVFTIAIFIFIHQKSDYLLVPLLNGLGIIVGSLFSFWVLYKKFDQPFKLQKLDTLMIYFKESSQFFLSRASVSIYTSANTFVLGLFTDTTMVGYYSIAEKLYMALQGFYSPIVQVLYPYVAKEQNIKLFKKIFTFVISINTFGILILYFIGGTIFDILFTQGIGIESLEVFHILLIAALVVVPTILIGYPFLGALGFSNEANRSVIFGSIVHLLGLLILVIFNHIGIYSVASMVVLTEIFVFSYRIIKIRSNKLWQKG